MKFAAAGFAASTRAVLYGSAAVLSLTVPGVAFAQDAEAQPAVDQPADDAGEGNDIVVTATKREQTLQEVPVAVTVTTAEAIERAQIRDLKDLSTVVPSLSINQLQSPANTNFYIRGFGNGANNAGIEPSVGVFVDGVYRSRTAAQIGDLPDVQRIEVLRGPQSTLFGKNASAGVISIVTQKPQFTFGGNVEASYGNYNAITFKGVVTGPVSQDLAVSLAGGYNKRDGYVSDLGTGHKTSDRNRWFVRGQALYEPSNDLKIRLTADYGRIDEICCAVSNIRSSAATAVLKGLGGNVNDPTNPYGGVTYNNIDSTNDIKNYGVSGQIDYEMGPLTLTSITAWRKLEALSNQDSDFTSADLIGHNSQDLGIKTFTQELRLATNLDGPVNFLLGAFYFNEKVRQSNELVWGTAARPYANTLVGAASGGALSIPLLEGTFGALEGSPAKYVGQFFKVGTGLNERYRLDDEAFSIFGQIDFEVTDGLTLTGGVNYTKDRKTYSTNVISNDAFAGVDFNKATYAPLRNQLLFQGGLAQQVGTLLGLGRSATAAEIGAFAGNNPAAYGAVSAGVAAFAAANQNNPLANPLNGLKALQLLPPFLNVPNSVEPGKTSDDKFTWTARLAYDVTDTVNVYLTYATGFKASSVNLTRDSRPLASDAAALTSAGLTVSNQSYGSRFAGPENSTVYEAGIKGNWGLASVNFAVFKQIIRGFQSNIFTGTGFFLANAGKQSSFGIEFEGMVKPAKGLTLSLGMTYLDPKYDEFKLSAFGDLSGTKPAGVAPISASFGLDYDHELGNGDHILLHGDYHYESKFQQVEGLPGLVVRNTSTGAVISTAAALAAAREFASEVNSVNASITYAMQNGLEVSIWGRNLLNDRYLNSVFDSPAQSGSLSGYPNQPLTWGGSIRFRW
jgi:outer membrane receptor protein involved in Fe transport